MVPFVNLRKPFCRSLTPPFCGQLAADSESGALKSLQGLKRDKIDMVSEKQRVFRCHQSSLLALHFFICRYRDALTLSLFPFSPAFLHVCLLLSCLLLCCACFVHLSLICSFVSSFVNLLVRFSFFVFQVRDVRTRFVSAELLPPTKDISALHKMMAAHEAKQDREKEKRAGLRCVVLTHVCGSAHK